MSRLPGALRQRSGSRREDRETIPMYPSNVNTAVVFPSPEEDDTKADIVMVFQPRPTGQRTVGKKATHSILNQKTRNARALPADVSLVQVNGK